MPRRAEPQTPRQFVDWAARRFSRAGLTYGHGTANARDDAAYLVLGALDLPFDGEASVYDSPLSPDDRARVAQLVERRIGDRVPVAYLVRRAWFAGIPLFVDQRVLIPRSPVAELIEDGFAPWTDARRLRRILDIGTGSGCIAAACALAFPGAHVDAVDISRDALDVAELNFQALGIADRVHGIKSDLFEGLHSKRYDLIVSNPPYVATAAWSDLPAEYAHEPRLALEAGRDGLSVVRRLLDQSAAHLDAGGLLVVEVGAAQPAVEAAFPELPFTWLEFERGGEGVFLLHREELPAPRGAR